MIEAEIVDVAKSGGTNTSHTILVGELSILLRALDSRAEFEDYEHAVLNENILGKRTTAGRLRALRYLKELYLLRSDSVLFRTLRELWPNAAEGQPLLAGLCAMARDSVFRASSSVILETHPGDQVTSQDLAEAVQRAFPDSYSETTLAKIGRNTFSSWEQCGHLESDGRNRKVRCRARGTSADVVFATLLGYLEGLRGASLLESNWAKITDLPQSKTLEFAELSSRNNLLDFRQSGGIVDLNFSHLLRPMEGQML